MKTAETTVAADSTESGSACHYFQCLQETIPWCFHLQVSGSPQAGRQALWAHFPWGLWPVTGLILHHWQLSSEMWHCFHCRKDICLLHGLTLHLPIQESWESRHPGQDDSQMDHGQIPKFLGDSHHPGCLYSTGV